jgi:uncharacterized protein
MRVHSSGMTDGFDPAALQIILRQFSLDPHGIHGIDHWTRVRENGLRLAASTGADVKVIAWFSLLHDCCRLSNGRDMDHGPRAAAYARQIRGSIDLDDAAFELLVEAVECHTRGCSHSADVTVKTCLDADRLDIGRVGIRPLARFLYTEAGKRRARE